MELYKSLQAQQRSLFSLRPLVITDHSDRREAKSLAAFTASGTGRPFAKKAAMEEAKVQPVPWVWLVFGIIFELK